MTAWPHMGRLQRCICVCSNCNVTVPTSRSHCCGRHCATQFLLEPARGASCLINCLFWQLVLLHELGRSLQQLVGTCKGVSDTCLQWSQHGPSEAQLCQPSRLPAAPALSRSGSALLAAGPPRATWWSQGLWQPLRWIQRSMGLCAPGSAPPLATGSQATPSWRSHQLPRQAQSSSWLQGARRRGLLQPWYSLPAPV